MKKRKRVLLVGLAVVLAVWFFWPQISSVTMLTPAEKELNGYFKAILPAERNALQMYRQLESEPGNATHAAGLQKDSAKILVVNDAFWKTGSEDGLFRRVMNKLRGIHKEKTHFLPQWQGPDSGEAALGDMRMDTRTLLYEGWQLKEDSNALATELLKSLSGSDPNKQAAVLAGSPLVAACETSLDKGDFVFRRWKGNYRPPLYLSP